KDLITRSHVLSLGRLNNQQCAFIQTLVVNATEPMYEFLQSIGGGSASKGIQEMCLEKMRDNAPMDAMFYP
uniref:hypothetical protein n=1 Tax=Xenorhabdus vietnamensis TaxID=351656 RepID=UPI00142E5B18